MLRYKKTDDEQGCVTQQKTKKGWAGWQPSHEVFFFKKKGRVKEQRGDANKGSLVMIQKHIEDAAKFISHTPKSKRQKEAKQTPGKITLREEAAARCSGHMERKVLRMRARRARADHAITCSVLLGKTYRKESLRLNWTSMTYSRRTQAPGNKSSSDTVLKCVCIQKRRPKHKKRGIEVQRRWRRTHL